MQDAQSQAKRSCPCAPDKLVAPVSPQSRSWCACTVVVGSGDESLPSLRVHCGGPRIPGWILALPTIVCEMLSLGAVREQHAMEGLDLYSVTERELAQITQDSLARHNRLVWRLRYAHL